MLEGIKRKKEWYGSILNKVLLITPEHFQYIYKSRILQEKMWQKWVMINNYIASDSVADISVYACVGIFTKFSSNTTIQQTFFCG